MIVEEKKMMDRFQKLDPTRFNGGPSVDAQDFLDRCHEIQYNLGLVESNGVNFTIF